MNLHFWAIAAIVAATQGLLLAILLFSFRENRSPNRLLGSLMLLLVITLIEWALWWTHLIEQVPGMKVISFPLQLLYGPLLFLYFQATFEPQKLSKKALYHLLPFAMTMVLLLPFYFRFYPNLIYSLQWIPTRPLKPWYLIPVFIEMIVYGIWMKQFLKPQFQEK